MFPRVNCFSMIRYSKVKMVFIAVSSLSCKGGQLMFSNSLNLQYKGKNDKYFIIGKKVEHSFAGI